jgi:hypothetical protein
VKRLRRIIINGLRVLSLLLCVGMVGLWVRSYWVADIVQVNRGRGCSGAEAMRGGVFFFKLSISENRWGEFETAFEPGASYVRHQPMDPDRDVGRDVDVAWSFLGLRYFVSNVAIQKDISLRAQIVPIWLIVLPLAIFGLWGGLRIAADRRRQKRRRQGLCPVCGYDLRATQERCPECGAIPDKVKA